MKVEVTKHFRWARGGNYIEDANVGDVLEGEGAVWALKLECGRQLDAEESAATQTTIAAPAPTPVVAPVSTKSRRGR